MPPHRYDRFRDMSHIISNHWERFIRVPQLSNRDLSARLRPKINSLHITVMITGMNLLYYNYRYTMVRYNTENYCIRHCSSALARNHNRVQPTCGLLCHYQHTLIPIRCSISYWLLEAISRILSTSLRMTETQECYENWYSQTSL